MANTMNIPGMPTSRWIDGILEEPENLSQRDRVHAIFFQGHAVNSQTCGPEMVKALAKSELVVISDPYPTHLAVLAVEAGRSDGVYLLPTCTQFETYGSVTASNRSLQWREQVIDPLFESKPDHVVLHLMARKLDFAGEMFKQIRVKGEEPLIEDVLREINRGAWTIGYTGQSPERLKAHARYRHPFNTSTLRAEGGPVDANTYGVEDGRSMWLEGPASTATSGSTRLRIRSWIARRIDPARRRLTQGGSRKRLDRRSRRRRSALEMIRIHLHAGPHRAVRR